MSTYLPKNKDQLKFESHFKFQQLSSSWVAINPNPKGIIQFIGSFLFGSYPLNSYKYLFQNLFEQGYTIFVFRFPLNPFSFNHWRVAINLLEEEYHLRVKIIKLIIEYEQVSRDHLSFYLNDSNYYWLGHSLGCKYISLLEILSNDSKRRDLILKTSLGERYDNNLISLINTVDNARKKAETEIKKLVNQPINICNSFIKDQPSILLAPEISNTVTINGVTIPTGNPLSNFELLVYPNARETKSMIAQSTELFNLTGIISFTQDSIARDDVTFLVNQLQQRNFSLLHKELFGWHFEPNGLHIEPLKTSIHSMFDELTQQCRECGNDSG